MSQNEKTIPIKKHWDTQPHINEKKGHHVIRKKEQGLLIDFIQRRSEGSLLVSGKRGVGKSSAIFSAISEIKQKTSNGKVIPVLVAAPHFDLHDGNQVITATDFPSFKKNIFQTLIRRLYQPGISEIKDKELKTKIEELYKKAVAEKVIREIHSTESNQITESIEKRFNFGLSSKKIGALLFFAMIGAIISISPLDFPGNTKYLTAILVGVIPTVVYSLKITKIISNNSGTEYKAQDYYKHDYDISNIQSDLEELLRDLSKSEYKIVFIVDEMDKMNPVNVNSAIRSLKSLITHGYAIFIFVTAEDYFKTIENSSKKRSTEYTLFTHTIFLQRPLFQEMEQYIDEILQVEEKELEKMKNSQDYRDFRNYLCYQSKIDFFDLNHVIRDHIVGYDKDGRPLLNYFMNDAQIKFARLQKAMGQVYSRKAYDKPSDWEKNDRILQRLYWFLETITNVNPGANIRIIRGKPFQIIVENQQPVTIEEEVEASAISDLINHLSRLTFFDYISADSVRIRGTIVNVPKNHTDVISNEELELVKKTNQFQDTLLRIYNLLGGKLV